ncbi:hypothetical protein [Sphingomonas sp.]|uniref:hypothetical protein n=1 Tax=Sphingomonas sp. TaxID=28214 RepID=UPI002B84888D|nr:hypothetical protein [Sphingomonas sp.]HTG38676.1 hypothetical protein [Sphingomonas sp.]
MRMRAGLSLLGAALLSACGGESGPTVLENEAREAQTAATMAGWDRAFSTPRETIGRVNQFGFHAGDYAADGDTFLTRGDPITMSQSDAKAPNKAMFEAAGPTANRFERMVFTLAITDPANADTAKQRFADMLRAFLSQYELEDEGAFDAVIDETDADGPVAGTPASIAVDQREGDQRTITVTFTRPTGTTPVIPDQGQADGNRA